MTEHGKDASQRAELKERIIATATEAFTTKGIKSITMDDIAAALGISKRTLYEVFVDKESLLKDCILTVQAERDRYLQEVYEQSHNVLEVILAVFQKSIEMFHKTNKRFFEDIKKYPKVYNMMKERSESGRKPCPFLCWEWSKAFSVRMSTLQSSICWYASSSMCC